MVTPHSTASSTAVLQYVYFLLTMLTATVVVGVHLKMSSNMTGVLEELTDYIAVTVFSKFILSSSAVDNELLLTINVRFVI